MLIIVTAFMISFTVYATTAGKAAMAYSSPVSSFTFSPTAPMPYDIITFDASGSYAPGGYIVQYTWDFGDGSVITTMNPTVTHSYPVDGSYTVELTVVDNNSLSDSSSVIVQVSCLVFFRAVFMGTLIPMANVQVTVYGYNGTAWVAAPVGSNVLEITYDNMTQPNLASTNQQKYRNPGYTASTLREKASNIGFDVHQSNWNVYFKFQWGPYVAYWPNETTRVYSYNNGAVETHDYNQGHKAYWDAAAGTYVIKVSHIQMNGVCPIANHPIIVGILCPPTQQYYLTTRTDPLGIATIPGEGWYNKDTNATLTAPSQVVVSATSQYRFSYWDVDGTSRGAGVNPIVVQMNANHTATAHYVLQYSITFAQTGLTSDATGTIATVDGAAKTLGNLPYVKFVDCGASVAYSYNSIVTSTTTGKRYRLNSVTGPTSPITISGPITVTGNYVVQYSVTFTQTGLDSTATGTVVTVNSNGKTYADLPYTLWVDNGGSVTYFFSSPVLSTVTSKRFRLTTVSGPTSPIALTNSVTVAGNYVTQYQINFTATGLDVTAGSVLTVDGTTKAYSDLPYSIWIDSGLSVTYSYNDVISSSISGKRFKLTSVTGPSSPILVTTTSTVTGNYKTQYQVTFDQSGVGSDFAGTIATIDSVNYNLAGLPTSFWWDKNTNHSYSFFSPLTVAGSQQYMWSSTSGLSNLQSGTLTITSSGNVVGNYVVQNAVTFDQFGASSDYSGTAVTIDGTPYTVADLPRTFSWQIGTTHSFAFQSPLIVTANAKQYGWTSTSGLSSLQSGSIIISASGSVVGNYKTQYYLTVSSPFGTTTGQGWYNDGATAYASLNTGVIDYGNGTRQAFTNWNGDASGTDYTHSNPITMNQVRTAVAAWNTQYQITFDQTGVGSDFSGTIVTADGHDYSRSSLPVSFWWDSGSAHTFSFASPLSVTISKRYNWVTTTGLSTLQSDTLTITASGSVVGNYVEEDKYPITFDQTGIGSDYTGNVLTIDGADYKVIDLPVSFWWDSGSAHTFSYSSPLLVGMNTKQYAWISTSGLSTAQSDSITVTSSGSITGNYNTQYYLTLAASPPGITGPTGEGWYDAGTNATVSTQAFIDITPGSSRYRFSGWTTSDMPEISNPSASPTSVLIDKPKTVTADYVVQYRLSIDQSGTSSDFSGTIITVDGVNFAFSDLPASFWYDTGSVHTFTYQSPLIVTPNVKTYVWTSTTGLSTTQSEAITVSSSGSITGNYKTRYYLAVTSPYGSPSPASGWYDSGTTIPASINSPVSGPTSTRYVCTGWTGTGSVPASGSGNTTTFQINASSTILWSWKTQYYLTVAVDPAGLVAIPGEGWYDISATVPLNAPPVTNCTFVNWDVDGTSVGDGVNPITVTMSTVHTATAHYHQISVETLTASIDPLARTMTLGTSVTFSSTVQGGKLPYSYQWYLNGQPVSGATTSTWTFTPSTGGIYYVYLRVTDADHTSAQSETARIDVISNPVGGYSISKDRQLPITYIATYIALVSLLGAVLSFTKRKRK
jgi:hypothetical protein